LDVWFGTHTQASKEEDDPDSPGGDVDLREGWEGLLSWGWDDEGGKRKKQGGVTESSNAFVFSQGETSHNPLGRVLRSICRKEEERYELQTTTPRKQRKLTDEAGQQKIGLLEIESKITKQREVSSTSLPPLLLCSRLTKASAIPHPKSEEA